MSAYGAAFKEAWMGALENVKQRQAMAFCSEIEESVSVKPTVQCSCDVKFVDRIVTKKFTSVKKNEPRMILAVPRIPNQCVL